MRFQEVCESASLFQGSGPGTVSRSRPSWQQGGGLAIEVRLRGAKGDRAKGEGGPAWSGTGGRVDPEGSKIPKGEWKLVVRSGSAGKKRQRAARGEAAAAGKPEAAVERDGRTGCRGLAEESEVAGRER